MVADSSLGCPAHCAPLGDHGKFNDVDTAKIQTEVFMLPVTTFAEEDGSLGIVGT